MNKREKFLEAARSQVGKGIYVWGAKGQDLLAMDNPEAWIRKKETTSTNAKKALVLFAKRKREGVNPIRAFDCSGLVYWANTEADIGYPVLNSRAFYRECDPVEQLEAGDLVFHHNGIQIVHVGIYNGDGYVLESMGRDEGVVLTKRNNWESYWNRRGRLKKLKDYYNLLGDVNLDGKVTAADAALLLQYLDGKAELNDKQKLNADVNLDGKITRDDAEAIMEYIVGNNTLPPKRTIHMIGSLCLRDKGSKKGKIIGYAHKGADYPLLGRDPETGWYMTQINGKIGFISNKDKYSYLK
jgi:hypothetical protein